MSETQFKLNSLTYDVKEPLILESGDTLQDLSIQYTTYGELNHSKSNVIWVFHALTANSNPAEWWDGLIGEGQLINPERHFIICANMIGSCYGSSEPGDFEFPLITIRDMVNAHKLLKNHLGIEKIYLGIGGSMGGQQLLQWAVTEHDLFENIVGVATNAKHSAWGIAFNEAQRMALNQSDLKKGLEAARAIAMLSYRNYSTFTTTQSDEDKRIDNFSASSYQHHQGSKLSNRFSPFSYYYLSKAMDSHNIGIGNDSTKEALSKIKARAVIIGIESDILFPLTEQEFIGRHIPDSTFYAIRSLYGHDGFLIETGQLSTILKLEFSKLHRMSPR